MAASIIIDIILTAIIITGAVIGIRKGFLFILAKPVKFFAALLCAYWLSSPVASGIIQPIIQVPLMGQISDFLMTKCEGITAATAEAQLPTLIKFGAYIAGIDITNITSESTAEYIGAVVEKLTSPVIYLIALIISFIILYFLFKLIFAILFSVINGMFTSGVLGALNRTIGFVVNTFMCFVVAWVLVLLISYLFNTSLLNGVGWISEFEGGIVYKLLRKLSPVDILLSF